MRERVESLQDTTLRQRVGDAAELADQWVGDTVRQVVERHRAAAQVTVSEFNEIAARYQRRLEALSAEFEGEVEHLRERFDEQREAFEAEVESLEIELPPMPEAVEPTSEADGWIYDSDRDFIDQTEEFRRRQKRV